MKRKLLVIFSTLIILLMPIMAYADMSAPATLTYEAVVTNPNGADAYSGADVNEHEKLTYKKKINYDTKIKIFGETTINGKVYGGFEQGKDYYYVALDDIVPTISEFLPEEHKKIVLKVKDMM